MASELQAYARHGKRHTFFYDDDANTFTFDTFNAIKLEVFRGATLLLTIANTDTTQMTAAVGLLTVVFDETEAGIGDPTKTVWTDIKSGETLQFVISFIDDAGEDYSHLVTHNVTFRPATHTDAPTSEATTFAFTHANATSVAFTAGALVGVGLGSLVEDLTPQLGGMLDVNDKAIGDGTRELLTFVEDASAINHLEIENQAIGGGAILRATGDDTNVDGHLATKGSGKWIVDATLDIQGSITVTGTVDGRDLATDGTKLDTVETSADVTDATNVAAAGAVMDADFSTNGLMIRTASGTYTNRTIVVGSAKLTISNGDGVSGNPSLDFGAVALADLSDVGSKTGSGTVVVMDTSPTIVTPTIASFTNATHNHEAASGGGTLSVDIALAHGGGSIGVNTTSPDVLFHTEISDAATTTIVEGLRLSHITSGTAAVGFGAGLAFELEGADGTNLVAGGIDVAWTDASTGAEDADMSFKVAVGGAAAATKMTLTSAGFLGIGTVAPSDLLTIIGGTLSMPGSSGEGSSYLKLFGGVGGYFIDAFDVFTTEAKVRVRSRGNGPWDAVDFDQTLSGTVVGAVTLLLQQTVGNPDSLLFKAVADLNFVIMNTGSVGIGTATPSSLLHTAHTYTASSGVEIHHQYSPIINQTSTAGYTAIELDVTETAIGSGANLLLDLQVGGTSKFNISNAGVVTLVTSNTTGITHNISMIPSAALALSAVWHGLHIDGSALDPSGTGAEISGIEIDLSGVDLTNDPVMHGIEIAVPIRKDAMHIHEGQIVINNAPDATATSEFHALDVRVDTTALVPSSVWSAMSITAVGASSGQVDAILARNQINPIRQEIGTFATPSQTEFAGRKTGGGSTWVDGIDGIEIFIVISDELYVGSVAQFSQIEVIMSTPATKDTQPTFWYNTAADTWTQFFPDDETSGFQTSSLISWIPSSISGSWTNDGDPGAGDTSAGYWIKIIRTRNADPGTPTPTTIKVGTVVTHIWNASGNLDINELLVAGATVFNEAGIDVDWRVEGIGEANALFVQGSDGKIGIGTGAPSNELTVTGDVDITGGLIIGAANQESVGGVSFELQVLGTVFADSTLLTARWAASSSGPNLVFAKSRGASIGTLGIVQDDDVIGSMIWYADDGVDLASSCAIIRAAIDGTPGANDVPGRIEFLTTADGASTATERMRIDSAGNVGINTTAPASKLHVLSADSLAIPVLTLEQLDVGEEMFELITTIGTGNAIEVIAAKTLTTTHFIKITIPGALTRYIPCGTIA